MVEQAVCSFTFVDLKVSPFITAIEKLMKQSQCIPSIRQGSVEIVAMMLSVDAILR